MVKIRLMRVGKRKQPSYRVVVADARSPRDGRIIEAIGHYQPRVEPSVVTIDNERALYWLRQGAQPSDSVKKLLRITGAWAELTGEAPPPPPEAAPATRSRAKATPAASVTSDEDAEPAPPEASVTSDEDAEPAPPEEGEDE